MNKMLKDIPLPDARELYRLVTDHNNKYDEHSIAEKARRDAEQNIPATDANQPSAYEKQLVHEASILGSKIATRYKKALEMLDASIKAESEFLDKEREHLEKNIKESAALETDAIDNSHALTYAHRQLEKAEERYDAFYKKYNRGPIVYIPHWAYMIFAAAIFAGEIPLNALVFQIFGENQVMTWIMAGIIGLSVPLGAHFIGIKFREKSDGFSWSNFAKGLIASAVIIAALYGLSVMRKTYLYEFREELGLTSQLVESSFLFFWLNIAVLGAAVMIAYLSHDPVPGYQEAQQDVKRARKDVAKLEKHRLKNLKKTQYRKMNSVRSADKNYRDGLNTVTLLKGHYDMLLKEGQELERQCLHGLRIDIETYRRENLQARSDKQQPECFREDLSFDLQLTGIKEKLVND